MSRVKRSVPARSRRRRILKLARGFYGGRSRLHRTAREAVERAWRYAYRDRKSLAQLALEDPKAFAELVAVAKAQAA